MPSSLPPSPSRSQVVDLVRAGSIGAKFQLRPGARIAALGSSTLAANTQYLSPNIVSSVRGGLTRARQRDYRFDFTNYRDAADPRGHNGSTFAVAGSTISTQGLLVPDVIAAGYDAGVIGTGINETTSPAQTVADILDAAARLHDGGVAVFLRTLNPRGATGANALAAGASMWRKRREINDRLLDAVYASSSLAIIDAIPYLVDETTAREEFLASVTYDGLHLNAVGAWREASAYVDAFRRYILGGGYDFTASQSGLLYGGALASSGGSIGLATTGSVPGETRHGSSGATTNSCVAEIKVDADEGSVLRATYTLAEAVSRTWWTVFSPTPATSNTGVDATGWVGKWVRGRVRVMVEDGVEYITSLRLLCGARQSAAGAETAGALENYHDRAEPIGDATMQGVSHWLVTDPFLVPAGTTHVVLRLETIMNSASGTIITEASRPAIFEVDSPVI